MKAKLYVLRNMQTWFYHGREVLYATRAATAPDCFGARQVKRTPAETRPEEMPPASTRNLTRLLSQTSLPQQSSTAL